MMSTTLANKIQKKLIFVSGVPGSGKSTFARTLSNNIIQLDKYRFTNSNWDVRDNTEYVQMILNELESRTTNDIIVLEGNLNDVSDTNDTNIKLVREFIDLGCMKCVYIMKSNSIEEATGALIDRCCRRYAGTEENNESGNIETTESRANMLVINVLNYDKNLKTLNDLADYCVEKNVECNWVSKD